MRARRSSHWEIALAAVFALWSLPSIAMGVGDKEAIRQLSNEAASEFEAGHYQQALEKFQRAYESAKVPTLLVLIARTQVKLGHLVEAYESYHRATILEPNDLWIGSIQQEAQRDAQRELDELQPRVPRLTIRIEGASPKDVTVRIDDVDVPSSLIGVERLADPGAKANCRTSRQRTSPCRHNSVRGRTQGGRSEVPAERRWYAKGPVAGTCLIKSADTARFGHETFKQRKNLGLG